MSFCSATPVAAFVRANLIAAAFLVAVSGCASYHPKPLDPAMESAAFEARRLEPIPSGVFNLAALTEAATRFQPEVEVAASRRRAAEAAVITAGGHPNPTFSASAQKNRDATPGTSPWTYGFGLDVPIETAGKRDHRVEQAFMRARAAALREEDTRWLVRSRVREALLGVYPMEELSRRRLAIQQELTASLERRLDAGLASRPEVLQAHLALSQATLALEDAKRRRAEGMARLAAAVGVPVRALDGVAFSFDDLAVPSRADDPKADDVRRQTLLARPDVLAALADYDASQSALRLEIARQYPDVSVGPGYMWDAGAIKWSLALALALPVLNRNEGPIAEAEARREEAAASFRAVQAKAIGEAEEAAAGYLHAARLLQTAERILNDQRNHERSAQAAFRAGESDRLSLLTARLEAAAAETARADSMLEAWRAAGKLEDALRRPLAATEANPIHEDRP
ncbi:MAG: TolC family protein [Rhodocyclaceae bacterium]|nr:TolC family protein [Rhodocyclaceae bacterium]